MELTSKIAVAVGKERRVYRTPRRASIAFRRAQNLDAYVDSSTCECVPLYYVIRRSKINDVSRNGSSAVFRCLSWIYV